VVLNVRCVAYVAHMAELDYAFIADFARVEPNGTLTALGASWTHVAVRNVPIPLRLAVAGRMRLQESEQSVPMRIEIENSSGELVVGTDFDLSVPTGAFAYRHGRVGVLFAVNAVMPITEPGLVHVGVYANEVKLRDLYFEVLETDLVS